jgi:3D (Asp-Asp-Asp) domain-containing protein
LPKHRHAGSASRFDGRGRRGHVADADDLGTPTPSSANSSGTPLGVFEVTCHTGPGVTASGRPSSREVVSVDRRLFPFGTRLFIDQVGLRVAADTAPR